MEFRPSESAHRARIFTVCSAKSRKASAGARSCCCGRIGCERERVDTAVDLRSIPVYVRAGAFIPTVPLVQTTRDYSSETLIVHYYPDADVPTSSGTMYEDDGRSRRSIAEGQFELLHFDGEVDGGRIAIGLRHDGNYAGRPESRDLTLVVHNVANEPASVSVDGVAVDVRKRLRKRTPSAAYDGETQTLRIRLRWDHGNTQLTIE